MQDGHRTSINSAALTADEVARRNFPIVRKGFDPTDVRMFLDSIAEQLQALHDREDDLRRRLANAERLVAHPEMDEAVLTAALGEETTRVLRSAHDAAGDMKARAEEGASQVIHLAHEEAARIRAEGERAAADRSSEADVTVARIRAGAAAEADSVIEAARQESQAMMAAVQEECRGMVREAQEVRARVLGDLVRRRRALYGQVEQLRGGRQSLVEALREARRSFDHILETLQRDFDTGGVVQPPTDEVVTEASAPAATDGAGGRPESKARQEGSAESTAASGAAPEPGADTGAVPPPDETGAPAGAEGRPATTASPEDRPDDGGTPGPDGRPETTAGSSQNRRRGGLRVIRRSRSAPTDEEMRPDASVGAAATSGETEVDEGVRIIASSRAAVDNADATSGVAGDAQEEHRPTSARSRGRTRGRHRAPGSSAVDELFAKVRAGRSAPENRARTRRKGSGKEPEAQQSSSVAPQPPPEEPQEAEESTTGPDARPEDTAVPEAGPESTAVPESAPEDTAAPESAPEDTAAPEAGPESTSDPDARPDQGRETGPEGSFLRRRDDAIGPITVALSRRLKRALQDDQNELLDRIRSRGERPLGEILPPVAEHREHFRSAGVDLLDRAEQAGGSFLRGPARGGAAARNTAAGNGDGEKRSLVLADELATAIIDPLRRRLERSLGSAADPDEASLVENLGGAYREWKGSRIERVAGDHVVAAFSQGELGVARPGTVLRWIVDDGDERCPDCDDNALAGPLPRGARYPTGQAHPPAHSGCRCLLAPPPA